MTDRELLELAAKAAGIELIYDDCDPYPVIDGNDEPWNPLTDDGDALRLAVKLGVAIDFHDERAWSWAAHPKGSVFETHGDPYVATRRAIVRAAAEIGRSME